VPTAFVQQAVAAIAPVPVFKVPHVVEFAIPQVPDRSRFGLPAGMFLALVMYDFDSYQYRKNPDAALVAFKKAVKSSGDAGLVIKTVNSHNHPEQRAIIRDSVADMKNVFFIDEFLGREDIYELEACCDVLLSLHRAEGFGLAPAEMMYLGKPVIATGWSGNMEFMTPMNSYPVRYDLKPLERTLHPYEAGHDWAEADIDHAAFCLSEIIAGGERVAATRARAAADIRQHLSARSVGARIAARLELLRYRT
jgi:glycosyltransferase involved in cell wall biosynthesis